MALTLNSVSNTLKLLLLSSVILFLVSISVDAKVQKTRAARQMRMNTKVSKRQSDGCEECKKHKETPYYCPLKPGLKQCNRPKCPQSCEEKVKKPSHPQQRGRAMTGNSNKAVSFKRGESPDDKEETFVKYNEKTCELNSPYLRRLRPGSKYIEYRPANERLQIRHIYETPALFGLSLAEIHTRSEWDSVEMSSVFDMVNPKQNKHYYYVYGFNDDNDDDTQDNGRFVYPSDNGSVTFAMLDPRLFGKIFEKCAVLTYAHELTKPHLSSRLWRCKSHLGDGSKVAYGLFQFPPGSECYRKSEEECQKLKLSKASDKERYSLVEMGQTSKRVLYFFGDQRSWSDAAKLCEAKGLTLLDLDPKWQDALPLVDVIEQFLHASHLSPITPFWTSGRFDKKYTDEKFRWASTGSHLQTKYVKVPPPFPFSWWDNQKYWMDALNVKLHRRMNMDKPCVALAINPKDGEERPKINFKTWYCDYPMYPICYKLCGTSLPLDKPAPARTFGKEPVPAPDSCDKPPEPEKTPEPPVETVDPFDEKTCSSKSPLMKRLTPTSKFVDYQPKIKTYSVAEIKEQCKKYGLVPGEISHTDDWETVRMSGIGSTVAAQENSKGPDYFYAIGMDDSKDAGKIRNNADNSPLTFSLFNPDGATNIQDRCSVLESVTAPDKTRGLMMLYTNCEHGAKVEDKIAYGLCMFPRNWDCFKKSTEETTNAADKDKFQTLIDLGVTDTRSLFFNPVQRNWEDAKKFCEQADLQLLDFDPKWNDAQEVVQLYTNKVVGDGGLFQLTPFWTSGKLQGKYQGKTGKWESTGTKLDFGDGKGSKWLRQNDPQLNNIREGTVSDACVESSFNNVAPEVRFRPDYCDLPKYVICYRKSKRRRGDPPAKNTLGITVVEN